MVGPYLHEMRGMAPAMSVKSNAKLADISERTLQRARKELKVIVTRTGYPARSHWLHPDHKQIEAESATTQSPAVPSESTALINTTAPSSLTVSAFDWPATPDASNSRKTAGAWGNCPPRTRITPVTPS